MWRLKKWLRSLLFWICSEPWYWNMMEVKKKGGNEQRIVLFPDVSNFSKIRFFKWHFLSCLIFPAFLKYTFSHFDGVFGTYLKWDLRWSFTSLKKPASIFGMYFQKKSWNRKKCSLNKKVDEKIRKYFSKNCSFFL